MRVLVFVASVLLAGQLLAQDTIGWQFCTLDATTNDVGIQGFNDAAGTTITTNETEATPEIVALARSLQNDPVLIYDYVRNHIEFGPPTYGLHNGAHGCLMAGRGSDADQTALLAALLRVAGYTTRFAQGRVTYKRADLANWLGTGESNVEHFMLNCGYPSVSASGTNCVVTRFWVEMLNGSTWVQLDPAYKEYGATNSIDLASIMGYNQTQFLASAIQGASSTTNYVQSMNETNIAGLLTGYTTNLLSYVQGAGANFGLAELLEGRKVIPFVTTSLPTNMPHALAVSLSDTQDQFFTNLVVTVRIQHQGIDVTFKGYTIAARRLSLTYNAADSYKPQLRLDGALIATGTATTSGNTYNVSTIIDNPYNTAGWADPTINKTLTSGSTYIILCDFDGSSARLVKKHNLALSQSIQGGASATSEAVLAGGLYVSSLVGLRQWQLSRQLIARLANCTAVFHFFGGVFAQESGYYVDLPAVGTIISKKGVVADETTCIIASSFSASALEHGVLEQAQGKSKVAVSTIKLLQLSNASGKKTFIATSANWATIIRPNLTNYTSSLSQLDSYIAQGYTLVLPQDGNIQLNQWKGSGYVVLEPSAIVMAINGNLNGGYGSNFGTFSSGTAQNICFNAYQVQAYDVPASTSIDPVDLSTGDCLSERNDLTVGTGDVDKLGFSRKYNSGRSLLKSAAGYGWTHNHDVRATPVSHGDLSFGLRQPADGVALVVQGFVTVDLLHGTPDVKQWTAAVLASKWGMDQEIENAVQIQLGDRALEFSHLPDGSYVSPPGVTASLSKTNGQFILDERFGKRWTFNTNGTLAVWQDADSNCVRYVYNTSTNVITVSNNFGRALSFAYSAAGLLTNITDGLGRSVSYQYSASNLVACIDPEGNSWTYTYDTNRWLTSIKDPLSRLVASNCFNSLGQVQSQMNGMSNVWNFYINNWRGVEENPQGGRTVHYFDDAGHNMGVMDALSNRTYLVYDLQGYLITNIDARGCATIFQYDGNHNITNRIDALTNRTAYAYDNGFHLISMTDPLGNITRYGYDSKHHMTNVVDALSNVTIFAYFSSGLPQSMVAGNRTVNYTYNSAGALSSITRTDGGTVSNQYNSWGDITAVVDANGRTNYFTCDKRRLLTSDRDALGYVVSNIYDAVGSRIKTIDRNGNTNQFAWTPTLNIAMEVLPNGGTNRYDYDLCGRLLSVTDPLGHVTSNRYDNAGRRIGVIDPLGNEARFALDPNGNAIAVTNALGHVFHTELDYLSRPINVWDVVGGVTRSVISVFDAGGQLISTTDADGYRTQFQYDSLGRRIATIKPDGTIDRFENDRFGNLTTYINGEGRRTVMDYDGMNRQRAHTDPVSNRVSYAFDAVGNLLARTNADGSLIQYQYTSVNCLQRQIYPGGVTNTYSYNKNRALTNAVNALGGSFIAYDNMNLATQSVNVVGSLTSTVAYAYNLKGKRIRVVYPGGLAVTNTFDNADQLVSVTDWGGRTVSYSYNAVHSPTGTVYPSGVAGTFTWDDASRLTGIAYATNGVAFIDRDYVLDAVGDRVQEDVNAGLLPVLSPSVRRLTQDVADKLTAVNEKTYPDSGTWTSKNPSNDLNGNMLADGSGLTLGYDADNRVTNSQSAVIGNRAFFYTGDGKVSKRIVNGTIYIDVFDGPRPLMTLTTNGTAVIYYVWGNGLISQIGTNGAVLYAHTDGQGSVLAMTATNGVVTDQWFYSPYGQVLNRAGTTVASFQWLGGYGVASEGGDLYRMYHRFYHAGLMRFASSDPLGLSGGANLFAYGKGNPLTFLDFLGLCPDRSVYLQQAPRDNRDYYSGEIRAPVDYLGVTARNYGVQPRDGVDVALSEMNSGAIGQTFLVGIGTELAIGEIAPRVVSLTQSILNETRFVESPTVFRQGTFEDKEMGWTGNTVKGSEWATDNPLATPNYPQKYGLPAENSGNPDWVVSGQMKGPYTTRSAPPSHNNPANTGGATEVVPKNPDDVALDWFYMPD